MTTIPTQCLECSAPLSPAETQGLCACCLLKMRLASQFGESSVADAGARKFIPPPMFPFDFGGYRVLRLLGCGRKKEKVNYHQTLSSWVSVGMSSPKNS